MAILITAHAQLTRGRQEALISGPENQRLARTRGPYQRRYDNNMCTDELNCIAYIRVEYDFLDARSGAAATQSEPKM